MKSRRGNKKNIVVLGLITLTLIFAACGTPRDEGRFPVCKSNADCQEDDASVGRVCWNLRCVECRYDTDCVAGSYCSEAQQCRALSPAIVEDTGPKGWEPSNVDECMKACKDRECVDVCSTRFPEKTKKNQRRR